jgi:hypothetical protein
MRFVMGLTGSRTGTGTYQSRYTSRAPEAQMNTTFAATDSIRALLDIINDVDACFGLGGCAAAAPELLLARKHCRVHDQAMQ